jgi:ankyrin repeat protein
VQQVAARYGVSLIKAKYAKFDRLSCQDEDRKVGIGLGQFPVKIVEYRKSVERKHIAAAPDRRETDGYVQKLRAVESLGELCSSELTLLLGRAGIGKSSLCKLLCRNWARKSDDNDTFDCVLYVDLLAHFAKGRKHCSKVQKVIRTALLSCSKSPWTDEFVDWLDRPETRVLWVLDGFDEVQHKLEGTVFAGIGVGTFAVGKSVLVATRPEIESGEGRIDRSKYACFELTGFSDEDVDKYIDAYFGQEQQYCAERLKRGTHDSIKTAMRAPLLLELLCFAFEESGDWSGVVQTGTLYDKAIDLQLRRSGKKHKWWGENESKRDKMSRKARKALQRLAWNGFFEGRGFVHDAELSLGRKYIQQSGLLKKVDHQTWIWGHFSVQEFLAAEWACKREVEALSNVWRKMGDSATLFFGFVCSFGGLAITSLEQWYPKDLQVTGGGHVMEIGPIQWIEYGSVDMAQRVANHWRHFLEEHAEAIFAIAVEDGFAKAARLVADSCPSRVDISSCDIHTASEKGYVEIVEWLLYSGWSGKVEGILDRTPLHCACDGGYLEVAKLLVSKGFAVDATDYFERTAFDLACIKNHVSVARWLLHDMGANVSHLAAPGCSVLHTACLHKSVNAVHWLIEELHMDVNHVAADGSTALHWACAKGLMDLAMWLVDKKAHVGTLTSDNWSILHYACRGGHLPLINWLVAEQHLRVHDDVTDGNWTPLHIVCCKGRLDMRVGHQGVPRKCCEKRRLEAAKWLVNIAGLDPRVVNDKGITALHTACWSRNFEIARWLIKDQKVSVDVCDGDGWSPLHIACHCGDDVTARWLLEEMHANPHLVTTKEKITVFHLACVKGCLPLLKLLPRDCSLKVSVDAVGKTPLHVACESADCLEVCQYLVDLMENLDIDLMDDEGWTPLHLACYKGRVALTKWLLRDMHANPKLGIKEDGSTPMHLACQEGFVEIVKLLLEQGGDSAKTADNAGITPRETAADYEHWDVVELLDQVT